MDSKADDVDICATNSLHAGSNIYPAFNWVSGTRIFW